MSDKGRKYRLSTLGLPGAGEKDRVSWQRLPERLKALRELQLQETRALVREQGFAAAMLRVLEDAGRSGLPALLKDRLARLTHGIARLTPER